MVLVLLFLSNFLDFSHAAAQEKATYQALQHEVAVTLKLVQVYVTDRKGHPVTDLMKEDFVVYDNGKMQPMTEFEKHTFSLPSLTTGPQPPLIQEAPPPAPPELLSRKFLLIFDFAFNSAKGILKAKEAALHFLDTQVQPSDEVGVLSYSILKSLKVHEFLTTDHGKIRKVVESFGLKDRAGRAADFEEAYLRRVYGENPVEASTSGRITFAERANSPIEEWTEELALLTGEKSPGLQKFHFQQDSSVQALHYIQKISDFGQALRYVPGFKHIILFSSGIPYSLMYGVHPVPDTWNVEEGKYTIDLRLKKDWDLGNSLIQQRYEAMLKELAASNSTVYTLDTEDQAAKIAANPRLKGVFTLEKIAGSTGGKYFGNINKYQAHLEKIQNLTACYYVLGYYIDETWDGKYHEIKIDVTRPGCRIHGQRGYFNPKPFPENSRLEKMLQLIDLALSEDPLFQKPSTFPLVALSCSLKKKPGLALFSRIPMARIQELSGKEVEIISIVFDKDNEVIKIEREEKDFFSLPREDIYYSFLLPLSPGEYKVRLVLRNMETGKGAVASSSVVIPKDPERGIRLFPPLLLKQERAPYLARPSPVYPFDSSQYSPLIEDLKQGTKSLFAVLTCSLPGRERPDIRLSANLIHYAGGRGDAVPAVPSILKRYEEGDSQIFFIEIQSEKLEAGEYFLYFFAEEPATKLSSQVNTIFKIGP